MLVDNGYCFGCGAAIPIGLKLKFSYEVLSRVALTTLDMNWVTAELTTRMIRPAHIGKPLTFKARIVSQRSRLVLTSAEAVDEDSTVVATASAKLMKPH
jgi:acyl-coenzyme A thioesterase PaaI-like protein